MEKKLENFGKKFAEKFFPPKKITTKKFTPNIWVIINKQRFKKKEKGKNDT